MGRSVVKERSKIAESEECGSENQEVELVWMELQGSLMRPIVPNDSKDPVWENIVNCTLNAN